MPSRSSSYDFEHYITSEYYQSAAHATGVLVESQDDVGESRAVGGGVGVLQGEWHVVVNLEPLVGAAGKAWQMSINVNY